ncbi:hypothetical protein AM493_07710 [Flavobacterium akiainvivens]|uniref:Uncharacterized protein n=1 Tax=Flavobacterium akiainvivens TaxID=1202724 RepID=A0A0M9VI18_9FLAO|nr:hypothetical protein [Flavobacterium akiainvivens]KOS05932.1 hypothetical protein AM493_07710 [Flavobacterium akiainvivens]
MNKFYNILFLAALLPLQLSAQYTAPDCGFYGNKTIEQCNALFPFNVAKRVVLVSFPCPKCNSGISIDSIMKKYNAIKRLDVAITGHRQKTYAVKQEATLSQHFVNRLSNLLVNYTFKEEPEGDVYAGALCYDPRNAILFYDAEGNIICCYEMCFECQQGQIWPDPNKLYNSSVVNNCPDAYRLLKLLFSENGITYGINEQ